MISASNAIENLLKSSNHISTSAGALIEYNLNTMVENIKATSLGADHVNYTEAFKKLFPIDTIYKPFRPVSPGIKYLIYTSDNTDTPINSYTSPKKIDMSDKPRLYYPGNSTVYKYWVGPKNANIQLKLEYFKNSESNSPVKLLPTNKIVARFETSHGIPSSWNISAIKEDGSTISVNGTSLENGEAVIYFDGTTWSTTKPSSYSESEYIKSISLSAINSGGGKFLGVLELSPRWVVDVSNDLESFSIIKETGADETVLMPVGTLTANSLNISLNRYKQNVLDITEYNRADDLNNEKLYLFKNAIIKPYIGIKSGNNYDKIFQGTFFMHSWEFSEFGKADILALDSTKVLQETLSPEILSQDVPVTSVIRRLLDSIGFSNYYIHVKKDSSENVTDSSVPSVRYWWSQADKTVWEHVQELCRDIQMNAFVDENNVLNFYTRDYIYDNLQDSVWKFTSEPIQETVGGNTINILPNIISFTSREMASANEVKIRYSTPITSEYESGGSPLWKSEETFLGAGGLALTLPETELEYFNLEPSTIDTTRTDEMLYEFSGYVLINNEVIEYDGAEYQYTPIGTNTPVPILVKSVSDIYKYRSLSKPGYEHFKPTGRYKIKKRGALQTKPSSHDKSPSSYINVTPNADPAKMNKYSITISTPADSKYKPGSGSFKTPSDGMSKTIAKSFLTLSNLDQDKRTFDIAVKNFDAINTSSNYLSCGTRMFFDSQFNSPEQAGGIAFCIDGDGSVGYYLIIRTTAFAGLKKDVLLIKQFNAGPNKGKIKVLKDSQGSTLSTLAGIYAGQAYNIDILVKKDSSSTYITAYINGFKITAQDTQFESGNDITINPNSPTKNVGLMCGQGVAYFEYVYGTSVDEDTYNKLSQKYGYDYNGVYSDDTMSMLYGDLVYKTGETSLSRKDSLLEFGTTAREIRKAKVVYSDKPGIPIKFSTAKNKYATVLDTRMQPFSAEAYILNNTSTVIPLDDGNYASFYVLGNSIFKSSPLEYSTYEDNNSINKEPVIFESNWIQSESDAKSLAEWIKSTILNKGKLVEMDVFGNPLICPGDIVTINYPLQGLSELSGKYIVTRVNMEYREGVFTNITCRAI